MGHMRVVFHEFHNLLDCFIKPELTYNVQELYGSLHVI
jgi:hypothetical protein